MLIKFAEDIKGTVIVAVESTIQTITKYEQIAAIDSESLGSESIAFNAAYPICVIISFLIAQMESFLEKHFQGIT